MRPETVDHYTVLILHALGSATSAGWTVGTKTPPKRGLVGHGGIKIDNCLTFLTFNATSGCRKE